MSEETTFAEKHKNPILTPVKYSQESRMILDANGDMVCHFMWNTHRPHWRKVDETAQIICDLINADYSRFTELETKNIELEKRAEYLTHDRDTEKRMRKDAEDLRENVLAKNAELRAEVKKWRDLAGKKAI